MKKEDLKELGIEDEELVKQIIILHGKDIESLKATNDTNATELDSLRKQLEEASQTIESFKKLDVDGIKAAADEWKAKAEQADKAISSMRFDYALEKSLSGAKAKSVKAVRALLDTDSLKLTDDGTIEGLDDQLEAIKSENEFLFDSDEPRPRIVAGAQNKTVISDLTVEAARKAAGLGR